ncbi:MAG: hypothetical protein H6Q29_748, partial [Bacteroidetes bacterium]|nr:hypothetical protein [Bacteroidota bacterium]
GSYTLLEKMEEDHRQQPDRPEFLKARLMDVYLGDWDRHPDQWRWAGFRASDGWKWVPIPRDRDQAFARFDGVMPWISELAVPQLTHFSDSYPQINDLTWSGRHLDRRFLSGLTREEWDSVTVSVSQALTDQVIAGAVRQMPAALLASEGPGLEHALRERREGLPEASEEYYELIAKYPDIHASDRAEFAEVVRRDDAQVSVAISARDPETGGPAGAPFFSKTFHTEETAEIRLLMHGGDDSVVVSGEVGCSPEVHVDGGDGKDHLIDKSSTEGWFLGFVPFLPVSRTKTYFYDSGKKTVFVEGPGTSVDRSEQPAPATEDERWRPETRDYGHDWKFGPWFSYTPDDGLFIGGGPILYEFGFHARPYVYRMSLLAGYSTGLERFRLEYTGEFYSAVKGARLSLRARASGIDVINYFGRGNETTAEREDEFYKIRQRQVTLESALDFFPGKHTTVSTGLALMHAASELDPLTLLGQEKPYGTDDISLLALTARVAVDTRDNQVFPLQGVYASGWGILAVPTWNNDHTFGRLGGEARAYLTNGVPLGATLAFRMMGQYLFGTYPFFEASFLGGSPLLRGFDLQRFAGDGMTVGSVEVRVPLARFFVLVPETFGITAFGETGRVFVRGEPSRRWHPAAGGGIWFSFIDRNATLSLSIARSAETTGVYVMGGFMF